MRCAPYEIAIPSYQRAETLARCTLALLAKVAPGAEAYTTIFVADAAERDRYAEVLGSVWAQRIVVAEPGMRAVRNFIQDYYADGTMLVCLDDDIRKLDCWVNSKTLRPLEVLDDVVMRGFAAAVEAGARLWGIYPVPNPYFMRAGESVGLYYIEGAFWGCINHRAQGPLRVTLDDKEDFERTLQCFAADDAVVRLNDVTMTTRYYTEPGGMQVERTPERVTSSAKALVARFPTLCALNTSKKSGRTEVRMRRGATNG